MPFAPAFAPATRKKSKLRLALCGPSGSGKTFTALTLAKELSNGQRFAVIDSEHGSASLYSDRFDFDVVELDTYAITNYLQCIHAAEDAGYGVCVIDSLTHAWSGTGGALDMVNEASIKNQGNKYVSWRDVTPLHNQLVDAIIGSPMHVICTMRSKMEYVQEEDDRGKKRIRKVGMAPIQRDGMEYEFTCVGDLDADHNLVFSKSRCTAVADKVFRKPGPEVAKTLLEWLNQGTSPPDAPKPVEEEKDVPHPTQPHVPRAEIDAGITKALKTLGIQTAVWDFVMMSMGVNEWSEIDDITANRILRDLRKAYSQMPKPIDKSVVNDILSGTYDDGMDPVMALVMKSGG